MTFFSFVSVIKKGKSILAAALALSAAIIFSGIPAYAEGPEMTGSEEEEEELFIEEASDEVTEDMPQEAFEAGDEVTENSGAFEEPSKENPSPEPEDMTQVSLSPTGEPEAECEDMTRVSPSTETPDISADERTADELSSSAAVPKAIKKAKISYDKKECIFTGTAVTPVFTLKIGKKKYVQGTDFEVVYKDNDLPGQGSAVLEREAGPQHI